MLPLSNEKITRTRLTATGLLMEGVGVEKVPQISR